MITTHNENGTLHVAVSGRLDLSQTYDLTALFAHGDGTPHEYAFDMQYLRDISDAGLSLLLMFALKALRMGSDVSIHSCSPRVARRIAAFPPLLPLLAEEEQPLPPAIIAGSYCSTAPGHAVCM